MLGLNRKEMEEARLARQRTKRKRDGSISPPPTSTKSTLSQKKARIEEAVQPCPDQLRKEQNESATVKVADARVDHFPERTLPIEPALPTLKYPQGTVKRTSSIYHEHNNDVTFEEVIEKDKLRTAVFSSFQWDLDWFFSKLNMIQTNMVLVMGAMDDEDRAFSRRVVAEQGLLNVRLCFPKLSSDGIMHSKLMLLFYETHMRIVVPTANLVAYDWGETGLMENTVFMIDLPRRSDVKQATTKDLGDFGNSLHDFLAKMEMQENVMKGILNFDFSETSHLGFVYSAAGKYPMDANNGSALKIGYLGMQRAVETLNLQTSRLQLDYVTSSLGLLDTRLLQTMQIAASGSSITVSDFKKLRGQDDIKVYFPSTKTVKESMGGPENGGTICLRRTFYKQQHRFRRDVLLDHHPVRSGILSHSKIMFARGTSANDASKDDSAKWISWAYIGSANLTTSAWGSLSGRSSTGQILQCRNWECGVIVPGKAVCKEREDPDVPDLQSLFAGIVDIPFDEKDLSYDGKEPWISDAEF